MHNSICICSYPYSWYMLCISSGLATISDFRSSKLLSTSVAEPFEFSVVRRFYYESTKLDTARCSSGYGGLRVLCYFIEPYFFGINLSAYSMICLSYPIDTCISSKGMLTSQCNEPGLSWLKLRHIEGRKRCFSCKITTF